MATTLDGRTVKTVRIGKQGPAGAQGPKGDGFTADASGTFAGRSAHDAEAAGFAYISTDGDGASISTSVIFIREGATPGVWSDPIPFQGPQGPAGAQGPQGPAGATGAAGADGTNFTVDATDVFANRGDYDAEAEGFAFLSTDGDGALVSTAVIFIRQTATPGVWSDAIPFQGPAGPQGPQGDPGATGADGKTWHSGAGAPAGGLGGDGDYYFDTDAHAYYGPKTGGAWGSATSLIGPGAEGAIVDGDFAGPDGMMIKTGAGAYAVVKINLTATAAPTVDDDSGDGYAVGSRWVDVTNDEEYVCLDASAGAAVWKTATVSFTALHEYAFPSLASPADADYFIVITPADGSLPVKVTTWAQFKTLFDARYQGIDPDTLKSDVAAQLSAGFNSSVHDLGTIGAAGTATLSFANPNVQKYVNNGAHTLAPPATGNGTIVLKITNGAAAGAITTSGFTAIDGDAFTTVDGDKFLCFIAKHETDIYLSVKALP